MRGESARTQAGENKDSRGAYSLRDVGQQGDELPLEFRLLFGQ